MGSATLEFSHELVISNFSRNCLGMMFCIFQLLKKAAGRWGKVCGSAGGGSWRDQWPLPEICFVTVFIMLSLGRNCLSQDLGHKPSEINLQHNKILRWTPLQPSSRFESQYFIGRHLKEDWIDSDGHPHPLGRLMHLKGASAHQSHSDKYAGMFECLVQGFSHACWQAGTTENFQPSENNYSSNISSLSSLSHYNQNSYLIPINIHHSKNW